MSYNVKKKASQNNPPRVSKGLAEVSTVFVPSLILPPGPATAPRGAEAAEGRPGPPPRAVLRTGAVVSEPHSVNWMPVLPDDPFSHSSWCPPGAPARRWALRLPPPLPFGPLWHQGRGEQGQGGFCGLWL